MQNEVLTEFPADVFPAAIRDYIEQGAASIGISTDFIGVPLFAYIGGVMGKSHSLTLKRGWDVWPTFWTCVIAQTGTGKTPGDNLAKAPAKTLQIEASQKFDQEIAQYDADVAAAKKDPGLFTAPANRPYTEEFIATNITMEAIADALQHGTGITISKDEIIGLVTSFNAYRGGRGIRAFRASNNLARAGLGFGSGSSRPVICATIPRQRAAALYARCSRASRYRLSSSPTN